MRFSRGQISVDAMMVSAVALLFFLALFSVFSEKAVSSKMLSESLAAERIVESVARAASHALVSGNGSVSHAFLPDSLPNNLPYNISVRGRQVVLNYPAGVGARVASAGIATSNTTAVNYSMSPGTGGIMLNLTNSNGTIVIVGG